MGAEKTKNVYGLPYPKDILVKRIGKEGPAHKGPFRGALDFIVDLGTPVTAPLEGRVIEVVDFNEKYGPTKEYKNYLNYVTILHANGEYSQLAHLEKGSVLVKKRESVHKGQQLAVTGNSGWMEEPHLHMLVFRLTESKDRFKGLEIKFET